MAVTPIPEDIKKNLQVGWTKDYRKDATIVTETYIGPVDTLSNVAKTYKVGEEFTPSGQSKAAMITVSRLEKIQSDQAKWTLSYGSDNGAGGTSSDQPISELWSCTISQYQFPLEKYLNKEEAGKLRDWEMKEPNEQLSILETEEALTPGTRQTLPGKSFDVAKLKFSGVNEVIRCYPVAKRVSIYNRYKRTIDPDLNTTGTEPNSEFSWTGDNEMSWLKVQFDWEQQSDGTWQLTESWQGSPTKDGGWNSNLYDEWDFYVEPQTNNSNP